MDDHMDNFGQLWDQVICSPTPRSPPMHSRYIAPPEHPWMLKFALGGSIIIPNNIHSPNLKLEVESLAGNIVYCRVPLRVCDKLATYCQVCCRNHMLLCCVNVTTHKRQQNTHDIFYIYVTY